MKTVKFEMTDAVFQFRIEDVVNKLKNRDPEDESRELQEYLSNQTRDEIEIPQEKKSFLYLTLDLLASNKGSVFCKTCGKGYQAHELVPFPVGAGENPLKVKVGYRESLLKRIFGRPKRIPLFGGKGYRCPKGHQLIGLVTWRT
jgi:hypothetical protein